MSPDRRKVIRLEDSKENWKQKALDRAAENRRLKERISDLEESRDAWKSKAAEARKTLDEKLAEEKQAEAGILRKAGSFFLGLLLLPFVCVALCLFGLWLALRWCFLRLAFFVVERHIVHHILPRYQDGLSRLASTSSRRRKRSTAAGQRSLTLASMSEPSASSASFEPSNLESTRGDH
jgi:hypothetical protein